MVTNRIREYRDRMKLSQKELSDRLPNSPGKTVLSLIENGHVLPTTFILYHLCKIFDCTPLDLYDATDLNFNAEQNQGGSHVENRGISVNVFLSDEIIEAISEVGYNDVGDWLRESKRKLLSARDFRRMTRNTIMP